MVTNNTIIQNLSSIWEETDGCENQYRCKTYFYLWFIIAAGLNLVIDNDVESPGHGEDVVGGLNAVGKNI